MTPPTHGLYFSTTTRLPWGQLRQVGQGRVPTVTTHQQEMTCYAVLVSGHSYCLRGNTGGGGR